MSQFEVRVIAVAHLTVTTSNMLSVDTEDNRRQILASGGVTVVLEVLSLHMSEASAVLEACRTLRNLTCDGAKS
jgi:hypothetical protein